MPDFTDATQPIPALTYPTSLATWTGEFAVLGPTIWLGCLVTIVLLWIVGQKQAESLRRVFHDIAKIGCLVFIYALARVASGGEVTGGPGWKAPIACGLWLVVVSLARFGLHPTSRDAGVIEASKPTPPAHSELSATESASLITAEDYRMLFDNHPAPLWVIDELTLRFLAVNEEVIQKYGYTREEFLLFTLHDVSLAEDIEKLRPSNVEDGPTNDTVPWRHRTSSGVILCTDVLTCQFILKGRAVRMIVAGDWTNRKLAEEQLRQREAFLTSLLTHIPCGVFWKDRASIYLGCNQHVARDRGLRLPDEIVGLTDCELIDAQEEADSSRESDRHVIDSGMALLNTEETRTCRDGTKATLLTSRVPMKDVTGKVVGVLGVYKDITERKRLEDQFRHAQKMQAIGRLAGGIAHDFNNLLTIIVGNAHLIRLLPRGDAGLTELVDDIHEAADRAAALTRQLLTFSRKQPARPEVLDINQVVTAVASLLRRLLGEPIRVQTLLSADPVRVRADRGQLEQVVMNLAVNAKDAMPTGGTLTIATDVITSPTHHAKPGSSLARLTVSDTGEGMTEEVKARIFEPFYTTKDIGKGTGLGLATVYGIVEQAGGSIEVQSAPGAGTTFQIQFPSCESAISVPLSSCNILPSLPTGKGKSVLLVEDEDGIRKLARLALQEQGYTVIDAERGEVALEFLTPTCCFDLLITDLAMPGMDGRELASRVRALRPEIGVVFISGYAPDGSKFADVPGAILLPKPFTPVDLTRIAVKALRRAKTNPAIHDIAVPLDR